ncbi:hypothetical protein AcW1_010104 [Taiwanofungus camphoratus]|nr:hypothetical protein AcV5_002998 [Antrodia cinnamomea]KAI0946713.1 hypothetical protein AcW1_010104 [Antrodia cinnamomea]
MYLRHQFHPDNLQGNLNRKKARISAIESRLDLLLHLGYTVFAFNQTVQRKLDPKTHINVLDPLLSQLRKRTGAAFLKRLTIVLDEESEKGFGLTTQNASLVSSYDLIALAPTTATSFSLACLTHTPPSPLTAHIISLPLTLPRLPFHLKHTLVRTALKNGAVFEINYVGALGGEGDPGGSGGESGAGAKRNWWAAAREVVRVTKGKGILVSGGVSNDYDLRAPKDVCNLITLLGLPQNVAHDASTRVPQSLILRAQTRRTYRAVLSEPRIVIPGSADVHADSHPARSEPTTIAKSVSTSAGTGVPDLVIESTPIEGQALSKQNGKKRPLDEGREAGNEIAGPKEGALTGSQSGDSARKRKKKIKDANA